MKMSMEELQTKKLEYLQEIYELTLAQKEALKAHDLSELGRLISEKEKFMLKVDQIDKALQELGEKNYINEEGRQVILEAITIDRENKSLADKILFNLKGKIGQVKHAKKFNKAYQPNLVNSMMINRLR